MLTPAMATKAEKEIFSSAYRTEQLLKYMAGLNIHPVYIILFYFLTK
jgi:hypothetical protein